jgi:hypothetical protein
MSEKNFEIKINVPMIKELVSDKIYRSDASAFREQYVNALSHGVVAYYREYGYDENRRVHVHFDYGLRKVTITDNGMGMTKNIFSDNFMSFGFSTVGKDTNNTRSGLFGLGAISFFRIAAACIVESWDRKTDERFCFMTRNTDESEFVTNRTLEEPGTRTEIVLKEHVRIQSLVEMVKTIAVNYPAKTVLEISNSEGQQTVATYNNVDSDSYEEYEPVMEFKDYVSKNTDGRFVELINNDQMEVYLSTTGRNVNHTYLCRVPIDINYSVGFSTWLNIKQEKMKGEDRNGKEILKEIPKPDRDEVNENAEEYFSEAIANAVDEMIYDIDIKNFAEYQSSNKRWILDGFSVDDKLNPLTHAFVRQLRVPVRYRNEDKIQKRQETLLTLFAQYTHIMYHGSLHKGTYESINKHLTDSRKEGDTTPIRLALVDNKCGQPLVDAKEYKKAHKVKTIHGTSTRAAEGLLVRDGSWNNYRISNSDTLESLSKKYPGGIYYADNIIKQNETNSTGNNNELFNRIENSKKSGIIISQKAKKLYPSLRDLIKEMIDASKKGDIVEFEINREGVTEVKHINFEHLTLQHKMTYEGLSEEVAREFMTENSVIEYVSYHLKNLRHTNLLPIQCYRSMKKLLIHSNTNILFMPTKFIYTTRLAFCGAYNINNTPTDMIEQLKYVKDWKSWDDQTHHSIWKDYNIWTGKWNESNYKCRGAVIEYFKEIYSGEIKHPTEIEFKESLEYICSNNNSRYHEYRFNYDDIFPVTSLVEKAHSRGWSDTLIEGDKVYGISEIQEDACIGSINGNLYAMPTQRKLDSLNYEAVLDDEGNPVMVMKQSPDKIVIHEGKPVFKHRISKWD